MPPPFSSVAPPGAAGVPALLAAATRAHQAGDLAGAERLYRAALHAAPAQAAALTGLGASLAQQDRLEEAIAVLERAVAAAPDLGAAAPAWANLGNALQQSGRLAAAVQAFARAEAGLPRHPELAVNLGNALRQLGRADEALASYERALALAPGHARALLGRAGIRMDTGRFADALADIDAALLGAPADAVAHYNRGVALQALQRPEECVRAFERAAALDPKHADALYNLALAHRSLERDDAARDVLERALLLRPDDARFHATRGHLHLASGAAAAALASYETALALRPGHGATLLARADTLRTLRRYAEAAQAYEAALAVVPDDPDAARAHFNWATCHLRLGQLRAGWEQFEWRWADPGIHPPHGRPADKLWLGRAPIDGKVVLLHGDQGYGDMLQFCRYAPLVAARGARVLLEVAPPLQRLLQTLAGVDGLYTRAADVPDYDVHTPLSSLPLAFDTTLDTIPAGVPYLSADPQRIAQWRERLDALGLSADRPRVGLAWSGNPRHANDANRSIALQCFARLCASAAGRAVQWVSLQREHGAGDKVLLRAMNIADASAGIADFADSAALMQALDLVISVDTANAHLAGALGRPLWLLLPFVADWRWLLDRQDSPWYPSARLWRQSAPGDWMGVLDAVESALDAWTSAWPQPAARPQ